MSPLSSLPRIGRAGHCEPFVDPNTMLRWWLIVETAINHCPALQRECVILVGVGDWSKPPDSTAQARPARKQVNKHQKSLSPQNVNETPTKPHCYPKKCPLLATCFCHGKQLQGLGKSWSRRLPLHFLWIMKLLIKWHIAMIESNQKLPGHKLSELLLCSSWNWILAQFIQVYSCWCVSVLAAWLAPSAGTCERISCSAFLAPVTKKLFGGDLFSSQVSLSSKLPCLRLWTRWVRRGRLVFHVSQTTDNTLVRGKLADLHWSAFLAGFL